MNGMKFYAREVRLDGGPRGLSSRYSAPSTINEAKRGEEIPFHSAKSLWFDVLQVVATNIF